MSEESLNRKYCAVNIQWWAYNSRRDDDYYGCCKDLIIPGYDATEIRCHKYNIGLRRKFLNSEERGVGKRRIDFDYKIEYGCSTTTRTYWEKCKPCKGKGIIKIKRKDGVDRLHNCQKCGGDGRIAHLSDYMSTGVLSDWDKCPKCKGKKKLIIRTRK